MKDLRNCDFCHIFSSHRLQSALEKERKRKAALLTSWTTQSVELKKKLRELEKEGEFSNVEESKEQLQHVIDKLKVSLSIVLFCSNFQKELADKKPALHLK